MDMDVQLMNTMAQHTDVKTADNANSPATVSIPDSHRQINKPMFHNFIGGKTPEDHPTRPSAASPDDSAPAGASSRGGRSGPISTNSDIGSERLTRHPIDGGTFYGSRSGRLVKYKRSNSDSTFMESAKKYGTVQTRSEVYENLQLLKMLRNGSGGERPSQPPASLMLPNPESIITNSRNDSRFVLSNVGSTLQFPMPPMQPPSSLYHDGHHVIGAPVTSQSATSDEGSRTGIKTPPGILNSVHVAGDGSSRKNSPMQLEKPKLGMAINTEPKCGHGFEADSSVCRQMTIFYGGQAHVFDEVAINKAELIMALAGSNGGSWSTALLPMSTPSCDWNIPCSNNETTGGQSRRIAAPQDSRQKIPRSSQRSLDIRFSNTS